eukprot:1186674-Prorocentrum_minimum.AAC.4
MTEVGLDNRKKTRLPKGRFVDQKFDEHGADSADRDRQTEHLRPIPCNTNARMKRTESVAQHRGYTGATQGLNRGYTGASQGLHRGYTGATQGLHRGFTGASQGLHRG